MGILDILLKSNYETWWITMNIWKNIPTVLERIVRIGTHQGQDRFCRRLRDHFTKEGSDGSTFRKNIGEFHIAGPGITEYHNKDMNPNQMAGGCGTGLVGFGLINLFRSMLFADASPQMIERLLFLF
ncbi:MAG: hypothetical protein WA125_05235 [Desulfosporosinus sp.]